MEDNYLILFIFKSIEISTLKPDSALSTLEKNGITLKISHDYFHSHNYDPTLANTHFFNNTFNNLDINDDNEDNNKNNNSKIDNNNTNNTANNTANSNTNNNKSGNFADFIQNPSKAWSSNLPNPNEIGNKINTDLLSNYINLLNITRSAARLKRLPKFITFGNAKGHLNEIFIPGIVCLFFHSITSILFLSLILLDILFILIFYR